MRNFLVWLQQLELYHVILFAGAPALAADGAAFQVPDDGVARRGGVFLEEFQYFVGAFEHGAGEPREPPDVDAVTA